MSDSKNKISMKLLAAIIFIALFSGSSVISSTLINSLLVVSYTVADLPYFYIIQASCLIIISFCTYSYRIHHPFKFMFRLKWALTIFLIVAGVLLYAKVPYIGFIICVLLQASMTLLGVLTWILLSDIFDLQEFKKYSNWLMSAGGIGAMLVMGLITQFKAEHVIYDMISMICIFSMSASFILLYLQKHARPLEKVSEVSKPLKTSTLKNPIILGFMFLTFFGLIFATLCDYSFKVSLSRYVTSEDVPKVAGNVFLFIQVASLFFNLALLNPTLKALGSKNIILLAPCTAFLIIIMVYIHPTFYFVIALFVLQNVLSLSVSSLAKNLYLNILPSHLARAARQQLSGYMRPISVIVAGGLIFLLETFGRFRIDLSLALLASFLTLMFALHLRRVYLPELINSLQLRRFVPIASSFSHTKYIELKSAIDVALKTGNEDTKSFALSLIEAYQLPTLPSSFKLAINPSYVHLSLEAAKILAKYRKDERFLEKAQETFNKTDSPEIKWYLSLYLSTHRKSWSSDAVQFIQSDSPPLRVLGCFIYLKSGDPSEYEEAKNVVLKMEDSEDSEELEWVINLLTECPEIPKHRSLVRFIESENPTLQALACELLARFPEPSMMDILIKQIGRSEQPYLLSKALQSYGPAILPILETQFFSTDDHYRRVQLESIAILSKMPGKQADAVIIRWIKSTYNTVLHLLIAKYLAYRGIENPLSDHLRGFVTQKILQEIKGYNILGNALEKQDNPIIRAEIIALMKNKKKEVLYYAAAIAGAIDILNVISSLSREPQDRYEYALAVELIDTASFSRVLSRNLTSMFSPTLKKRIGAEITDPWLKNFIKMVEEKKMESVYRLIKLRQQDLFVDLPAEVLDAIAEILSRRDMTAGEVIFNEGDMGNGMYLIDSGKVAVMKNGKEIAVLGENDYFGELALLSEAPRFASVIARTDGALFFLGKRDFDRITDELPEVMKVITRQVVEYLYANQANHSIISDLSSKKGDSVVSS